MSSNMAIPAVNIGGNIVQPTPEGKIKVTTAKAKVKVLSQDQFEKQIKKNAENIKAGKDFEIKKDNQALKVGGLLAGAAAIVAGVIYRKDLAKLFKKAGDQVSEAATKVVDKVKGSKTNAKRYNDTLTAAEKHELNLAKSKVNEFSNEAIQNAQKARNAELKAMKADAEAVFKNYDPDKALEYASKKKEFGKMTAEAEAAAVPKKSTKTKKSKKNENTAKGKGEKPETKSDVKSEAVKEQKPATKAKGKKAETKTEVKTEPPKAEDKK